MARAIPQKSPDPARALWLVLLLILGSVIFLDFWQYSAMHQRTSDVWLDVIRGTANAPAQYRIGVLFAADWMTHHAHLRLHQALAAIDLVSGFISLTVLASLFLRSSVYLSASRILRWFGAAVFCLLTLNYLLWLTWYLRPETLTNAALLALSLWLLTVRFSFGGRAAPVLASAGLVILAAIAGIVRADIPAALHAGVLIVLFLPQKHLRQPFALPRGLLIATSMVCGLVAAGCQFYMMRIRYPHATYGNSPTFMLLSNLMSYQWIVMILAIFPCIWTARQVFSRKISPDQPDLALFAGSLIFFALWITVGRMEEIRIFLPCALALMPLTATAAMTWIGGSGVVE